jgi:hypothetical protein
MSQTDSQIVMALQTAIANLLACVCALQAVDGMEEYVDLLLNERSKLEAELAEFLSI